MKATLRPPGCAARAGDESFATVTRRRLQSLEPLAIYSYSSLEVRAPQEPITDANAEICRHFPAAPTPRCATEAGPGHGPRTPAKGHLPPEKATSLLSMQPATIRGSQRLGGRQSPRRRPEQFTTKGAGHMASSLAGLEAKVQNQVRAGWFRWRLREALLGLSIHHSDLRFHCPHLSF